MDNAPYHSVKSGRIPNMSWKKNEIICWMDEKGVPYRDDMVKEELIHVVKSKNIESQYDRYVIDNMAKVAGHKILRLPPYHCVLNPIELV